MTDPMSREEALEHFGVKGMKWGVRNDTTLPGVSRRTSREAKKDADEFAKAKMFYGEGAGTRRKLINATVQAKAKKDPSYQKAFDHHLANQDLSKRASQARSERRRKDASSTTVKTIRGVHRSINGGFGSVSVASAGIGAAYVYAKQTGLDQKMAASMKTAYSKAKNNKNNMRAAQDILRNMGFAN